MANNGRHAAQLEADLAGDVAPRRRGRPKKGQQSDVDVLEPDDDEDEGAVTTTVRRALSKTTSVPTAIMVPPINIQFLDLILVGDSPLVIHRWSEKARKAILDKQQKKAKTAKEKRDPRKEYEDSLYKLPGGKYGFPTIGFKAAAVTAAGDVDGMAMTSTRRRFHVDGEFAIIEGEPKMREDMVRIGMGVADLRYRGEFTTWRTALHIRYNASAISIEQIVNLFNIAGFGVGVGENRVGKGGNWGQFHVETVNEMLADGYQENDD